MKSDKQLPKFLETSANSKNIVIESMRLEDEGGISMQKNMIRIGSPTKTNLDFIAKMSKDRLKGCSYTVTNSSLLNTPNLFKGNLPTLSDAITNLETQKPTKETNEDIQVEEFDDNAQSFIHEIEKN